MPEMVMRYKEEEGQARIMMLGAAKLAAQLFDKEVVWEIRKFGKTEGEPDFSIITQVTDNEDKLVEVALRVQAEVLDLMASCAYPDQVVEHWVQRVKGKWGQKNGTYSP